jgi:hypothetical protein
MAFNFLVCYHGDIGSIPWVNDKYSSTKRVPWGQILEPVSISAVHVSPFTPRWNLHQSRPTAARFLSE